MKTSSRLNQTLQVATSKKEKYYRISTIFHTNLYHLGRRFYYSENS